MRISAVSVEVAAEHRNLLARLAPRSAVVAPLLDHERVIGAISLVSSSRTYDAEDLTLAQELARRASRALENARLYREAQEAVDMREEVLRVVSHELGNPLSAIFVGLKVLRRQLAAHQVDEAREPIAMIHDSAAQLRRLIDDLLEVQRIEAGRLVLKMKNVDVPPLIERAADLMTPIARDKGIRLEHEARGAIAPVHGDTDRLLQVFGNLLGNAIKFTPRGGTVRLSAEPREGRVIFAVKDSGPGIAPDDLPDVFERFWRAKRRRSSFS